MLRANSNRKREYEIRNRNRRHYAHDGYCNGTTGIGEMVFSQLLRLGRFEPLRAKAGKCSEDRTPNAEGDNLLRSLVLSTD
jgi:hypothetical protein